MSCDKEFVQALRNRGMRMTPQREIILSELHTIEGFITAEELHNRVQEHSKSIDISTVYRTLELLESLNFVAHVDEEGQHTYTLLGIHGLHHHLHCTQCGKVIGIPHDEVYPLLSAISAKYSFDIIPTSWTFSGLCRDCQIQPHEVS